MLCNCKSSVRLPCANSVLCWPCAIAELVWSFLPNTPQIPSCLLFLRLCLPLPHSSPKLPSFQPFVKFSFPHFPNQTLHPKLTVCSVFRILYTPPTLFVFLHTNSILWESINPVTTETVAYHFLAFFMPHRCYRYKIYVFVPIAFWFRWTPTVSDLLWGSGKQRTKPIRTQIRDTNLPISLLLKGQLIEKQTNKQ